MGVLGFGPRSAGLSHKFYHCDDFASLKAPILEPARIARLPYTPENLKTAKQRFLYKDFADFLENI